MLTDRRDLNCADAVDTITLLFLPPRVFLLRSDVTSALRVSCSIDMIHTLKHRTACYQLSRGTALRCCTPRNRPANRRDRFVVVRDPAERLVSAFLNKCVTDGYMR